MTSWPMTMVAAALWASCRQEPGDPDYTAQDEILARASEESETRDGPDPWVEGKRRLSLGIFYEGGASELRALGADRAYYIFAVEGTSNLTYTQESVDDRVEGALADQLISTGTPWWGGGIIWNKPESLSDWGSLHVSLKSGDEGMSAISVKLLHGAEAPVEAAVDAASYGWQADGEWHHLTIPLADFVATGADLAQVRGPFVIGGVGTSSGESLLVDNLYVDGP